MKKIQRIHGIGFGGTALAGLILAVATGCGSGGGTSPITPPLGTSASPSVPVIIPTPLPSASPSANVPAQVGDFAFAESVTPVAGDRRYALAADGTGSTPFVLQSVNGFKSPITFPYTVTITGGENNQTLDSSLATVTLNPSTIATLPAGNTTVVLGVRAGAALPPLSEITVNLRAEGGGLQRFPDVGPYSNRGEFHYLTSGVRVFGATLYASINTTANSSQEGFVSLQAAGISGAGTFAVTGLPSGLSATFVNPTLTLDSTVVTEQLKFTIKTDGTTAAGTYSARVTFTVNGATYTSAPFNVKVEALARG